MRGAPDNGREIVFHSDCKTVFGNVVFTYNVSDNNGPGIAATFNLAVNPVQDGPRLGNLGPNGLNLGDFDEDTTFAFTANDLLSGYTDPDDLGPCLQWADVQRTDKECTMPLYGGERICAYTPYITTVCVARESST